jgi:hypothetical protein
MKYMVKFSCGHTAQVELFGKSSERDKKISYFEKYGVCQECKISQREIEKSIGCSEINMSYRQYKTEYADCNTMQGSYDGERRTITVYVPKDRAFH